MGRLASVSRLDFTIKQAAGPNGRLCVTSLLGWQRHSTGRIPTSLTEKPGVFVLSLLLNPSLIFIISWDLMHQDIQGSPEDERPLGCIHSCKQQQKAGKWRYKLQPFLEPSSKSTKMGVVEGTCWWEKPKWTLGNRSFWRKEITRKNTEQQGVCVQRVTWPFSVLFRRWNLLFLAFLFILLSYHTTWPQLPLPPLLPASLTSLLPQNYPQSQSPTKEQASNNINWTWHNKIK